MGISSPIIFFDVVPKLSAEFLTVGKIDFGIFNFLRIS